MWGLKCASLGIPLVVFIENYCWVAVIVLKDGGDSGDGDNDDSGDIRS